jgi:2-haloacid dehalogenase
MADDRMAVRALTFDTYGTVVDWRSSVLAELAALGAGRGLHVDWATFLADWKAGYRPGMDRVNRGEWPWTTVETIYRRRRPCLPARNAGLHAGSVTSGSNRPRRAPRA